MLNSAFSSDGPNIERLRVPLINAGIRLEPNSLINALTHKENTIAIRAALLLGVEHKTQATVKALSEAAKSEREILALASMQSLLSLHETNWISLGVSRLPKMKDRLQQIQLAGVLARANNVEGWKITVNGLMDPQYTTLALENLNAFDGKRQRDGKVIRVLDELQKVLEAAPESARPEIKREIERRTKR